MRIILLATIMLYGTGCASGSRGGAPAPTSATSAPSHSISMPEMVAEYGLTETRKYPEASAGTLYRYRGAGALQPDVFVYPVPRRTQANAGVDAPMAEGATLMQALDIQRRQRRIDSFEMIRDGPVQHKAGAVVMPGYHVAVKMRRRTELSDSHQYVFQHGDQLIKVRATWPEGRIESSVLDAFVNALLNSIAAQQANL